MNWNTRDLFDEIGTYTFLAIIVAIICVVAYYLLRMLLSVIFMFVALSRNEHHATQFYDSLRIQKFIEYRDATTINGTTVEYKFGNFLKVTKNNNLENHLTTYEYYEITPNNGFILKVVNATEVPLGVLDSNKQVKFIKLFIQKIVNYPIKYWFQQFSNTWHQSYLCLC